MCYNLAVLFLVWQQPSLNTLPITWTVFCVLGSYLSKGVHPHITSVGRTGVLKLSQLTSRKAWISFQSFLLFYVFYFFFQKGGGKESESKRRRGSLNLKQLGCCDMSEANPATWNLPHFPIILQSWASFRKFLIFLYFSPTHRQLF